MFNIQAIFANDNRKFVENFAKKPEKIMIIIKFLTA